MQSTQRERKKEINKERKSQSIFKRIGLDQNFQN